MALAYTVPGVYYEPRPRGEEQLAVRTDVAGFIGFDPRIVDDGSTLIGPAAAPVGHRFRVRVAPTQLVMAGRPAEVPGGPLVLSESATTIPLVSGQGRVYTVVAAGTGPRLSLAVIPGVIAPAGLELPVNDAAVQAGLPRPRRRLADVVVRRQAAVVSVTIRPALRLTRCDDFRDYELAFGPVMDDGFFLGPAVRAFFANGGRRCWVATVQRPDFADAAEVERARQELVGIPGSSVADATGLELLLSEPTVTMVDAPDLYARQIDVRSVSVPLPPSQLDACFRPCRDRAEPGTMSGVTSQPGWQPVFDSEPLSTGGAASPLFDTQRRLLLRCVGERWRVLLLLTVPLRPDPVTGRYAPPTDTDAAAWLGQFDGLAGTDELSVAAMYWPWMQYQPATGTPVLEMPPSAYAAGVIARRDLARGPQISPANETLRQVVGLTHPPDDEVHGRLYSPPPSPAGFARASLNVFRAFPGYGVQLWGARTLSTDTWLRFLVVRRTLTAIELRMKTALDLLVFEPNSPVLWLQITQIAFSTLIPLYESGALRGERPEQAFYVRCDASVNPPERVAVGELHVEVGVAIAAPMEFIVFRLGRREGVVEVTE